MPPGRWRRRHPLPPTAGTSVVCPIGEATPAQAADYQAARDEEDTVIPTIPDPLNPDPDAVNCLCGAPDVQHCDGCLACPGGAHDEMCGW